MGNRQPMDGLRFSERDGTDNEYRTSHQLMVGQPCPRCLGALSGAVGVGACLEAA
jgi:hypothetical protein